MTYNVHSCVGIDGRCSPERIAEVISEVNPDVACLQEIDVGRAKTGGIHQAERIAELLAMQFHFNPMIETATGRYGDAILSKAPFVVIKAGAFPPVPRPLPNESRGAIWVETTLDGHRWQVINTHLGLGREERRLQAAHLIAEWVTPATARSHLVVCGDFNSRPGSEVHAILKAALKDVFAVRGRRHPKTFSTRLPFVCLDYIYCSDPAAIGRGEFWVSRLARKASDHFPLIAELAALIMPRPKPVDRPALLRKVARCVDPERLDQVCF